MVPPTRGTVGYDDAGGIRVVACRWRVATQTWRVWIPKSMDRQGFFSAYDDALDVTAPGTFRRRGRTRYRALDVFADRVAGFCAGWCASASRPSAPPHRLETAGMRIAVPIDKGPAGARQRNVRMQYAYMAECYYMFETSHRLTGFKRWVAEQP